MMVVRSGRAQQVLMRACLASDAAASQKSCDSGSLPDQPLLTFQCLVQ